MVKCKRKKGDQREPIPQKATGRKPAVVEFTTIIVDYFARSNK